MKEPSCTPSVIEHFFCKGDFAPKMPGYVYYGTSPESFFKSITWITKKKGELFSGHGNLLLREKYYYVYVCISEVVEYILSSPSHLFDLTDSQIDLVREYAKEKGLVSLPQPKVIKPKEERKPKSISVFELVDLHKGNLGASIEIFLEADTILFTPSRKKQINLQRGSHKFVFIPSPLDYEAGTWLVLEKELPVLYGKSTVTWHQLLGYNPLAE